MKKLLLLLVFATAVSCSSSDDSPKPDSFVNATIDGVAYEFNTINIERFPYPDEGYTDVEITASIDNNPMRKIIFIVTEQAVWNNASWYFAYFFDDTAFPKVASEFSTVITESTTSNVKGTFSGRVESIGNPVVESVMIQNGSFEVYY